VWEIRNNTPFESRGVVVIDKTGQRHWVVVVKATFAIDEKGNLEIADEQVPPTVAPEYRGEPGTSSLLYEQDLIAAKPRTDVYLNGVAHAPGGRPRTEVEVALKTPAGTKVVIVRGDRTWRGGVVGAPQPSEPRPFVEMPITYERAYGGYDNKDPDARKHRLYEQNPVGTGFVTKPEHRLGMPMPNIEWPGKDFETAPAGFGAVCSYWQPRRAFQGTYDDAWMKTQKPLLPVDYDPHALQCAPRDQQTNGHLRGGEAFAMTNMHPSRPVISFSLPRRNFGLLTVVGSKQLPHQAEIHTIVIEPARPRVIVTWHSMLSCHRDIDDIDYTVVIEKRRI